MVGTDLSPGMVAVARERAAAAGVGNVEFHVTDDIAVAVTELLAGQPAERRDAIWQQVTDAVRTKAAEDGSVTLPGDVIYLAGRRPS